MPLKILVIEDMEVSYNFVLRELGKLLSMKKFEFINVKTIPLALDALEQDWDAILMDYYLGAPYGQRRGSSFENGADLITYRRTLERDDPEKKKVHIIGISASDRRNRQMADAGATCYFLKHADTGLAEALAALEKR